MIKSIKHKGLKRFFETGATSGIQAMHASKLRLLLTRLNGMTVLEDMNIPGRNLHPLKGDLKGHWSVKVSGNWRLIFVFEAGDVYLLDYLDYH